MFHFTTLPPLSLYIHFPWCARKCPYCDFNSHQQKGEIPEQEYINALIVDLEQELPRIWGRPIISIFMGGGTPSLFSATSIERLLSELRARLTFAADIEITLEANPGSVEQQKFDGFYQAGINRLSLGIQSFNDTQLQALGRVHNSAEALRAIETARTAGFTNINLDLMYALPQQTVEQALDDLQTAIALQPTHISHYQLTIEPNTLFYHQPPVVPDDDSAWDIQTRSQALLAEHGYTQYEVSAYARHERQCRHNMNYWQFGDYLGIGAGAHDKITDVHQQQITRSWKVKHPQDYLATADTVQRIAGQHSLTRDDVTFEFMMNALRLNAGFDTALFDYTGLPISTIQAPLHKAREKGLLEWDLHHIRPTELGRQYLNDLIALFLVDDR